MKLFSPALLALLPFFFCASLSATDHIPEDILDAMDDAAQVTSSCVLFAPGQPLPVIVTGPNPTAPEQYAAAELAHHLKLITGHTIEVVTENEIPANRKILVVGESTLTEAYDVPALGEEQYIIDIQPNQVVIVGGKEDPYVLEDGRQELRQRGTLYGVYEFLENLGVRWYRPEPWGWHIPQMDTLQLAVGKKVSPPPVFAGRSAITTIHQIPGKDEPKQKALLRDWLAKQRIQLRASPHNKYGGIVRISSGHAYVQTVPPEKYLESHPEYYALIDGKRGNPGSGRTPQLCLGNPELQEVFAREVIRVARKHPGRTIPMDPEDGTHLGRRMCVCPLCIAMDDPRHPNLMSNRVFQFTNIIAKKLAEEVPNARVALYAYSSHTQTPTLIDKLEPNIIVGLANINAWTDWSKPMLDPGSPQNARFVQLIKDWQEIAPHPLWMREYSAYGWGGPIPMYRLLQERLQTYRDLGMEGIHWPGENNWGPQTLLLYLKTQLQWNPDLDLDKELELYYQNYYGPAAGPMKQYHERWMEVFENSRIGEGLNGGIFSGGRGMHILCTPSLIQELGGYIEEAQQRVSESPVHQRRLKGTVAGFQYCQQIQNVLSAKARYGKPARHPRFQTTYLDSPEVRKAWQDFENWLVETIQGNKDLIFQMEIKNGKPEATTLRYMQRDILENGRYFNWDESTILREQGFTVRRR